MLDPFPFSAPPLLSTVTCNVGSYLGLDTLYLHIHEVILTAFIYHVICLHVSPWISSRLFPTTYPNFPWKTKFNWDVHVVSLVQSTTINTIALWCIFCDDERGSMDWRERVWGYAGSTGLVVAMAVGYFLWDLWVSVVHLDIFGFGLLAHAFSAFSVYLLGFRPFVNYYAPAFILYELSSPFLNFHWFLDKLDMTGSTAQFYNGILLMASFFGSRLVWGLWQSWNVFHDVFKAIAYQKTSAGQLWLEETAKRASEVKASGYNATQGAKGDMGRFVSLQNVPLWLAFVYLASNALLTGLNVVWFGKMVQTIRKRFEPPFGTKQVQKGDITMGRGLYDDGTKSIEVSSKDLRKRNVIKVIEDSEVPPPQ